MVAVSGKGCGGKRHNSGRKSKLINELRKRAAIAVNWTGQTPAEFYQELMQNNDAPVALRLAAAQAASPLVHQKQPLAVDATLSGNIPTQITILTTLDNDDA